MKLISMSVWGDAAMYWEGALANCKLVPLIYPGWQLRVYTDTENGYTEALRQSGCQIKIMENLGGTHGMFWRFFPASESGVEALIVRDADSRLNVREAAAVAAWLLSGKSAHVMRDHPDHLGWPMLGGMWGVRGGAIADIEANIANWGVWGKKGDDMLFLKAVIWPIIKGDCLQHTRGHSKWGGEAFPPHGPSDSDYVGQVYFKGGIRDVARPLTAGTSPRAGQSATATIHHQTPRSGLTPLILRFRAVTRRIRKFFSEI